jgi:predicted dehydrogenase
LEAILAADILCTIWVIDTNKESIVNANNLINSKAHNCIVNFSSLIPDKLSFDIAIIATDSKNRFLIAQELLLKNKVKSLVLEKVIFSNSNEYDDFKNLIDEKGIDCYVNLPRRLFPHYKLVKEFTSNCNSFKVHVEGASWGLLSNTLHFIDLIHFLFEAECDSYDLSQLTNFFPSKRNGYMEANGCIHLKFSNKGIAVVNCTEGNFSGILITLIFDNKEIKIQENNDGFMKFSWESKQREIQPLMVINTTSTICRKIISDKQCKLPLYDEIFKEHQLFIQEVEKKFKMDNATTRNQIWLT